MTRIIKNLALATMLFSLAWASVRVSGAIENYLGRLGDQGDSIAQSASTIATAATDLDDKLTPAIASVPEQLQAANQSITRVADAFDQAAGSIDQAEKDLNERLKDTNAAVTDAAHGFVRAADAGVDAEGQIAEAVGVTAAPIHAFAEQLAEAGPLWLDCDHNPDCAFNRYQGVSKAIEKASSQAPETAKAWEGISIDLRRVADKFTAKKRWYQKLEEAGWIGLMVASRWH